ARISAYSDRVLRIRPPVDRPSRNRSVSVVTAQTGIRQTTSVDLLISGFPNPGLSADGSNPLIRTLQFNSLERRHEFSNVFQASRIAQTGGEIKHCISDFRNSLYQRDIGSGPGTGGVRRPCCYLRSNKIAEHAARNEEACKCLE